MNEDQSLIDFNLRFVHKSHEVPIAFKLVNHDVLLHLVFFPFMQNTKKTQLSVSVGITGKYTGLQKSVTHHTKNVP